MPSPGSDERTFALQIDSRGAVLEILRVDGVAATDLAPDQLAFIGTYRPPLPIQPVGVHDEWTYEEPQGTASTTNGFATSGLLARFHRDPDADVAEIELTGEGPLTWTTDLLQGRADLAGQIRTRTTASLRVGDGALRAARSRTTGDFLVTVDRGRIQESGRLHLDLAIEVRRT